MNESYCIGEIAVTYELARLGARKCSSSHREDRAARRAARPARGISTDTSDTRRSVLGVTLPRPDPDCPLIARNVKHNRDVACAARALRDQPSSRAD
jgi:hypothetical protein